MIPTSNSGQHQGNQPLKPASPLETPAPPPPVKPAKSFLKTWLPVSLGIGFALLAGVAWLTYQNVSSTRDLEQKIAELEEAEKLRTELDNQYNQAIAELDKLKGDNEQINALIEQQKAELAAKKEEIAGLMKEKKKLDTAWAEIKSLKTKVAQYIADIEQLKNEQVQLVESNTRLKQETETLKTNLVAKSTENETLSIAKAQLVNEKEELSKSVQLGSVIKVKDISVTGYKVKKSGKTVKRESAKRVDQLKVCFTTVANEIVQPGSEQFFIRIISPQGETLAIDDLGSGTTVNSKTGEEVKFTQAQEYQYNNDETQLCFLWQPETDFQKGKYNVEIYNKGILSGKGEFELK
jgi:regulator of replication initiation timing